MRVNRDQSIESSAAYPEIGQYVYFAVSYDRTQTTDNVKFYKGTTIGGVNLVDTLTLNAGVVNQEEIPLSIGVTRTSGLTLNPFNGLLDDIRIDGSVVSIGKLESRRFAATGLDAVIAANPGNGGGLHISGNGVVRINDGTVSGNFAAGDGGGLWNSSTGNLIVDKTVINGNSAFDGGGVYSDGGNTVLTGVTVADNRASESGGGVYIEAGPSLAQNLTITDSVIDSNWAGATSAGTGGGGIFAAGFSVLTNTDIIDNTAIEGAADGGGVLAPALSDFSTDGGVIAGNRSARAGGGVENGGFFNSNEAMFGGALFGDGASPNTTVDRTVFRNNIAAINGGAIATEGGSLFVADSSFMNNTAAGNEPGLGGGAIFTGSSNEIINTDVIGNSASSPLGNGGGILVAGGGSGTYFGGLIQGNTAGRAGGGFEVIGQITIDQGFSAGDDVALSIDSNFAGINGGGVHITGTGDVTIRRAAVSDNMAAGEGGGLWNSASGTLTVDTVTITGNVASGEAADQGGGGIYNDGGTVVVNDTTLMGNVANGTAGSGGALLSVSGTVTFDNTNIDANGANRAGGVIEIVDGDLTLTNSDLVNNDVNGLITGGTPSPGNGGGLHVTGTANVTIDNGIVSGNVAAREGGGLWNQAGSTLIVRNGTLIQLNTALGAAANQGGGGIFNNGGVVEVSDAIILSNFADGAAGSGGGILNVNGGVITIADSEITLNIASRAGGGIEDISVATGSPSTGNSITLDRVTLDRNNAGVVTGGRDGALFSSPGNGGGLHVTGAGNIAISQSNFSGNIAANEGGGLWNSVGVMTIDASTIAENVSGDGGGIFNDSTSGDIVLTNSTISGNSASGGGSTTGSGGGLRTEGGNVTLTSVTIAMNTATIGGGLSIAAGTATIESSIVANNSATTDADVNGVYIDAGNNVVGGDAGLAALADNGGPTTTHALLANSLAINNGNNAGLEVDQRGIARPQGVSADSGAYESDLPGRTASTLRQGDVDGNGSVTALDALQVINYLGRNSRVATGEAAGAESGSTRELDVNGDGRVTALDALMIINTLGRTDGSSETDGQPATTLGTSEAIAIDSVLDQRRRVIDDLLLEQLAVDAFTARTAR
ncbi:Dockerin type I repeat protein [Rubripirellula tenax]|uniref:Dockerin type I repeat protein n=1 Tax=Rubripirellula tenax TaxID=2528015 RepID=A0A5C6EBQ9_9BACT|nr:choice-of-anchor Q domain-containing protein [Rubripirellula tenax]TWU46160.1 Dockerin type I repeat protein [Rubripirellula tenax]